MESSDSDNDNDCFESAEESIEEEETNNVNTKLNRSSPERENEFSEHISTQCNTVRVEPEINDVSGNTMSYRKRPEKVKHPHSKPSNKATSKSADELVFKPDKIISEVFLQDITSNLTKNINRSLSTLQQTSSNVKELILSTIPVSSCNNNERFSYDDKDLVSTSPDTSQDNKRFEFTGNMGDNLDNKEELSKKKSSPKEVSFSLADEKSDNVQGGKLSDIRPDDSEINLNKIQECGNFEVGISENFVKKEECKLKLQQQSLKNPDGTLLSNDLLNEESKESNEQKTGITTGEYSVSPTIRRVNSSNTEISEAGDQDGTICKENSSTNTINFSQNYALQDLKSHITEEITNEGKINEKESKEDSINETSVSLAEFSNSSAVQNDLIKTESTEDNPSLVTCTGKGKSNVLEEKIESNPECNLKELKTALENIIKDEKSSFENANENLNKGFEEGELIFKGETVEIQSSEEGWDDFDFSDSENEHDNVKEDNVTSIGLKKENKHIINEQVKTNKMIVSSPNSSDKKMEEQESSNYILREENQKKSSVKSCFQAVTSKSHDRHPITDDSNEIIEIKPASHDAWDWDTWEEGPESNEETTMAKVTENSECKNSKDESLDLSKWSGWDKFGQKSEEKPRNWGLGSWGVDALLNKATSVTQGISNVFEAGLGAPDPETLARMEKMERENLKDCRRDEPEAGGNQPSEVVKKNSLTNVGLFPVSGITSLVAGVTSKIVEHSKLQEIGSKVITGGLDTLETFGKKTMEVLQEGDPGLKNKRALLLGDQKPVLSQVLKEAREKAEKELRKTEERDLAKKCHFETLFDDFQGMVHLEALEMLSRQYDLKLEQLRSGKNSEEQEEFNAILEEVEQLCSLDECDMDLKTSSKLDFKIKLQMAVEPLKNEISIHQIVQIHEGVTNWLQTSEVNPSFNVINQKLVSTLAQLAAATVQQFHKSGELLSVKECRKTVEEVDALLRLTNVLCTEINVICEKFILFSKERSNEIGHEKIKSLSENVNNIMTNSTSYIRQAFNLLIPVLQFGAAVY